MKKLITKKEAIEGRSMVNAAMEVLPRDLAQAGARSTGFFGPPLEGEELAAVALSKAQVDKFDADGYCGEVEDR